MLVEIFKEPCNFLLRRHGKESDFDGNEDVRVFQVLGILKTESERKERDRQILKKSKVMWEEGTVECAWERERKTCVSGEDSGDKPF